MALASAGVLVLGLASCSADTDDNGDPGADSSVGGGILVYGLDSDVPNLITPQNQGSASMILNAVLHRGLVEYSADGEVVAALAETWENEGEQSFTFHLREGLTFHDGSALTSEDVKDTLEFMSDPGNSAKLYTAAAGISSIETPDDLTVVVELEAPDAAFLSFLADVSGAILPSETLGQDGPTYVGAGPFQYVSYEQGSSFVVEAFEDFYDADQPALDGIEFQIIADQTARDNALLSGSVDAVSFVGWNSYDQVEANSNLVLDVTTGPFMYLMFNMAGDSPFTDTRVRQAVAYAVDRQGVIDSALAGRGEILDGMPIPAGSEYYNADYADYYGQNLDRARDLLAEAGYPDGFTATMLSSSQYDFHENTAISVQNDLAQIGITLEMNLPDWPTRLDLGAAGNYDIAVYGTGGLTNDPSFLSQILTPSGAMNAPYGYDDPTVNSLLAEGRSTIDPAQRQAVYDELSEYVLEQAPIITLGWRAQAFGYRTGVTGFSNIPGFLTFNSGYTLAGTTIQ